MAKREHCEDIVRAVPRKLMQKGIDKCKSNITEFLQDAKIIAKERRLSHATVSAEFALEEFGKLLLLKNLNEGTSEIIEIKGKKAEKFCCHDWKVNKALSVLDPKGEYRVLFEMWPKDMWMPNMWETTEISSSTRLACAFVDFINGDWTVGRSINGDLLQKFIGHFEEELKNV